MKKMLNFIISNWFKIILLVFLFLFSQILKNGLDLDINISGWIEDEYPGFGLRL